MIPIAFPHGPGPLSRCVILAGDVGGTKTRLALFEMEGSEFRIIRESKFRSRDFPSLEAIIQEFQGGEKLTDVIGLGVAGPVINGSVSITNLPYRIKDASIRDQTGIQHVFMINDLRANAFGLAALKEEDMLVLHEGKRELKGNAALLSPGTGLGEAGLFWDGEAYHPFATEGGHTDYAPETEKDIALLLHLQKKYGHVSWERVVSGMGIYEIYRFLVELHQEDVPEWLQLKFREMDLAAAISWGSHEGEPTCQETMQMFLRNLANESANLVMKLNAFGGLFLGGGILPKNLKFLDRQDFVHYFLEAGRMGPLLEEVTLQIILNDHAALYGAAYFAAHSARPFLEG